MHEKDLILTMVRPRLWIMLMIIYLMAFEYS